MLPGKQENPISLDEDCSQIKNRVFVVMKVDPDAQYDPQLNDPQFPAGWCLIPESPHETIVEEMLERTAGTTWV